MQLWLFGTGAFHQYFFIRDQIYERDQCRLAIFYDRDQFQLIKTDKFFLSELIHFIVDFRPFQNERNLI